MTNKDDRVQRRDRQRPDRDDFNFALDFRFQRSQIPRGHRNIIHAPPDQRLAQQIREEHIRELRHPRSSHARLAAASHIDRQYQRPVLYQLLNRTARFSIGLLPRAMQIQHPPRRPLCRSKQ